MTLLPPPAAPNAIFDPSVATLLPIVGGQRVLYPIIIDNIGKDYRILVELFENKTTSVQTPPFQVYAQHYHIDIDIPPYILNGMPMGYVKGSEPNRGDGS